ADGTLTEQNPPRPLVAGGGKKAPAPPEAPPVRQRQILPAAHADAAIDRDAFGLHEAVVRHRRPLEGAVSGVLAGGGLMPVHLMWGIVHAGPQLFLSAINRFMWSISSGGAVAICRTALKTSAPPIGLTSIFSRSAASRNCGSRCACKNADCSARARSAGTSGGAANGRDSAYGISASSIRARAAGVSASSRAAGAPGKAGWRVLRANCSSTRMPLAGCSHSGCDDCTADNPTHRPSTSLRSTARKIALLSG